MTPSLPAPSEPRPAQLLDLAQEAAMHGFSQRLPVDWLQSTSPQRRRLPVPDTRARLTHRPEVPPQWSASNC